MLKEEDRNVSSGGRGAEEESMPGYVLAVDDDPAILDALGSLCQVKGVRYIGVATGQEAIRAAIADHPSLILLDLNMPGMEGPEVFRALRAAGVGSPTVLMSATANRLDQQAAALGFTGSLQKPFALAEMFMLMDRLIPRMQTTNGRSIRRPAVPAPFTAHTDPKHDV